MFSLLTISETVLSPSGIEDFRESVSVWGQLRLQLLGISLQEATFTKRGFSSTKNLHLQNHLEQIGQTFLYGYHRAIAFNEPRACLQIPFLKLYYFKKYIYYMDFSVNVNFC